MNFTLVFPSHEGSVLSVGLLFIPCAAWVEGNKILVVPNQETPHYQQGSLSKLLKLASFAPRLEGRAKNIVIVVHDIGHGTAEDLNSLTADCKKERYSIQIIYLRYRKQ